MHNTMTTTSRLKKQEIINALNILSGYYINCYSKNAQTITTYGDYNRIEYRFFGRNDIREHAKQLARQLREESI